MVKLKGFNLIELVLFLVIAAGASVGVLRVFQSVSAQSAGQVTQMQAQEAADSILEEILAMPFTFCDLSDPAVNTATSVASCSIVQGLTPLAGKARGSLTNPFNNVGDYGGYSSTGVLDITGASFAGLSQYNTQVTLRNVSVGGVASSEVIEVTVTITGPYGSSSSKGYKLRHSPNETP